MLRAVNLLRYLASSQKCRIRVFILLVCVRAGIDVGMQIHRLIALSQARLAPRHIYIADTENHRVVRMDDMSGSGWTTLRPGKTRSFGSLRAVWLDTAERIYVADHGLFSEITHMDDMAGANWTTCDGGKTEDFNQPQSITIKWA